MHLAMQPICALAITGLALAWSAPVRAGSPRVRTAQGKVRGKTINDGKVQAFLGLPYAAPPVGDLRWKAPQPPANWKGERDATKFGAHCAQNHVFDDLIFQDNGGSEDCLFLNVYAPAISNAKSKLPVMFWIHGGGYAGGAGSEPRHNGDFLPLKGVVLVTINYRLGVFGFLATDDLAKEANGATGNYGLLDMVAALQWVKANIGNFGGDPDNVTIFGESAGSFAVSTLMASPSARGLFHKAIGESGAAFSEPLPTDTLEAREKSDGAWVASLGAASLAELRALPADKVLAAAKNKRGGFWPVVDGKFLTEPVADTYAAGKQAHVPLLAGWNRDENPFLASGMTAETVESLQTASTSRNGLMSFSSSIRARPMSRRCARPSTTAATTSSPSAPGSGLRRTGKPGDSPVYRYHLELAAPPSKYHPGSFAFHSDDIEYVFGTLDTRPGAVWRPEDRTLSEQMMSYWTNFAKTGDPNGPGLPPWPKYDKDDSLIHLDSTITSAPTHSVRATSFSSRECRPGSREMSTDSCTAKRRPGTPVCSSLRDIF